MELRKAIINKAECTASTIKSIVWNIQLLFEYGGDLEDALSYLRRD